MRVLLVNQMFPPYPPGPQGGSERSVHELAKGLQKAGIEIGVVALTPDAQGTEDRVDGITVWRLALWNLYWPWTNFRTRAMLRPLWHLLDMANPVMERRVAEVIDRFRPDVIHTHGLAGLTVGVWRAASKRKIPVAHTLFDHYLVCPQTVMFRNGSNCAAQCLRCRLLSVTKRAGSRIPAALFSESRYLLELHVAAGLFPNARIREVVANGEQTCPRCSRSAAGAVGRGKLRAERLGFLGRLAPGKGIEHLLSSLPYDDANDWTLDVGGSGDPDYVAHLRGSYRDRRIRFLGHVDTDDFLHSVDLLVVPSRWREGGARVVLEAFCHGVPVIGSDLGGLSERIDDRRTGFLFDPEDGAALGRLLRKALTGQLLTVGMRAECLRKCREHVPRRYLQRHQKLYRELVGSRGGT